MLSYGADLVNGIYHWLSLSYYGAEALMQHTDWSLSVSVHVVNDTFWLQQQYTGKAYIAVAACPLSRGVQLCRYILTSTGLLLRKHSNSR